MILRIVFLFVALCVAAPAFAQLSPADRERDQEIVATDSRLDQIRLSVDAKDLEDVRQTEIELRDMLHASRGRLAPVNRSIEATQQQLDQLGPAPKEGEAAESRALAERRATLGEQLIELEGQRTRVLSNIDNATSLLAAISGRRLVFLYGDLVERDHSLADPRLWAAAIGEEVRVVGEIGRHFAAWRAEFDDGVAVTWRLALLVGAILISVLIVGPLHQWLRETFVLRLEALTPTAPKRFGVAAIAIFARFVSGVIGGFAIIETSRVIGLLTPEGMPVARAIWQALVVFLLAQGLVASAFSSSAGTWRLSTLDSGKGSRAGALILWLVAVFSLKTVFAAIAKVVSVNAEFLTVFEGVGAVIMAALLFLLCRRRLWLEDSAQPATAGAGDDGWRLIRRGGRAVAVLIIGATLAGFVDLGAFIVSRLYYLALLLAGLWFVRAALSHLAAWAAQRLMANGEAEPGPEDRDIARFWIVLVIDLLLLVAAAPALLVLVGLSWQSVRDIVIRAFIGFRVGGVVISLADVFWAIAVFVLILTATKLFQRMMKTGPFAHSRLDPGVQNSLTTLFGYIGLLIAGVAAVTTLGFNLSNLALIAGALSVGIGFGLQSIVNNFVSGLILLFERPIKVGDWIVTPSGEGIVQSINVRSTIIETWDRSTIIIPNSELNSSAVTNWTHKSKFGRIRVPVGVSYKSDPEKVRDILLKCAKSHPLVVGYPEPFVVWSDFGQSSLDFELRAFLRDISEGLAVRTELRYAIFKAFAESGIEIPFPQRDLHIKTSAAPGQAAAGPAAAPALPIENDENGES